MAYDPTIPRKDAELTAFNEEYVGASDAEFSLAQADTCPAEMRDLAEPHEQVVGNHDRIL